MWNPPNSLINEIFIGIPDFCAIEMVITAVGKVSNDVTNGQRTSRCFSSSNLLGRATVMADGRVVPFVKEILLTAVQRG